jgi:hypothetical protein
MYVRIPISSRSLTTSLLWYPLSLTTSRTLIGSRSFVLTSARFSITSHNVCPMLVVSPRSAGWMLTASVAPVSRSTACSALCARCVLPSFIFVIFASGSLGFVQSSLFPLPWRSRSSLARSSRVGVLIPDSLASRSRNSWYFSPVSRRTMLRSAALASSVVASIPTVSPLTNPLSLSRVKTKSKTSWCVSRSMRLRMMLSEE